MTCIKFYTGFSGKQITINDLYNRISYLYKAEEHLKSYLEIKSRPVHLTGRLGAASHEEGPAVMSLSTEETVRHINSINLQVEVTEYLFKCYSKKGNDVCSKGGKYLIFITICVCNYVINFGSFSY